VVLRSTEYAAVSEIVSNNVSVINQNHYKLRSNLKNLLKEMIIIVKSPL